MGDLVQRYEDAQPCDRWICDGVKAWMTGADCQECGLPIATDGTASWCTDYYCTPDTGKALGAGE